MKTYLPICAALLLVAGCGEGEGEPSGPTDSASASDPASPELPATELPTTDAGTTPNRHQGNDLSGFGATVANFALSHEASRDPDLAAGCCYGPLVRTAGGEQVNEYNLAGNSGPLVVNITRTFPSGFTERTAISAVLRDDLPDDVRRIKVADQGQCKVFVYRSKTLGAAAPEAQLGPTVSVALYPPPDPNGDSPYDSTRIEQAIELTGDGTEYGC